MEYLFTLIEKLPILKENLRAIFFLGFLGIILGFTGFPLWLAYRNDEQVLYFILRHDQKPLGHSYTYEQVSTIQTALRSLVRENKEVHRAIFGTLAENNRVILFEQYNPVDSPLPLGFHTVYLPSESYRGMLDKIRENRCYTLESPEDVNSYFKDELELTSSSYYVSCPSQGDWFLALYTNETNPILPFVLQETIKDLELKLSSPQ